MPTPTFRILNPAGNLVADRNAYSINFLGRATLTATVQPAGSAGSLAGRENGFSTYTFNSADPIFPVLELKSSHVVRLLNCTRSGATWTIKVYCGTATLDSFGFATQAACEVYIFGRFASSGGLGLKLRNDAGTLTHVYTDTDGPPLWARSRVSEDGAAIDISSARSIAALSKPAAAGFAHHDKYTSQRISSSSYRNHEWLYGWRWDSASPSSLYLAETKIWQNGDTAPFGTTKIRPSETLIINAASL